MKRATLTLTADYSDDSESEGILDTLRGSMNLIAGNGGLTGDYALELETWDYDLALANDYQIKIEDLAKRLKLEERVVLLRVVFGMMAQVVVHPCFVRDEEGNWTPLEGNPAEDLDLPILERLVELNLLRSNRIEGEEIPRLLFIPVDLGMNVATHIIGS